MNKDTQASYEANKKIRRDWGEISPVTKVIPDKRKKKRNKAQKKELQEEVSSSLV